MYYSVEHIFVVLLRHSFLKASSVSCANFKLQCYTDMQIAIQRSSIQFSIYRLHPHVLDTKIYWRLLLLRLLSAIGGRLVRISQHRRHCSNLLRLL